MTTKDGRAPSGQALAVPATPLRVDGPSGFDPSRIRLVGTRDDIRGVAERFRTAHKDFDREAPWKRGWKKGQIHEALCALDVETATPAEVADIIGNPSWIGEYCDFCNARPDQYFEIGDEPDYEARYLYVCLPCMEHLGAIAMEAAKPSRREAGSTEGDSAGLDRGIAQRTNP